MIEKFPRDQNHDKVKIYGSTERGARAIFVESPGESVLWDCISNSDTQDMKMYTLGKTNWWARGISFFWILSVTNFKQKQENMNYALQDNATFPGGM